MKKSGILPELLTLFVGSLLTAGIFVLSKRSVLNMSVSKYQIIQEVRELVPLAARQLQMMLEDPAVREVRGFLWKGRFA